MNEDGTSLLTLPGNAAWMRYVATRFPEYEHAAALLWWRDYAIEHGWWDRCKDEGHEFWCRFGEGTCARRGPLTCNDDEAWMAEVGSDPIWPTSETS